MANSRPAQASRTADGTTLLWWTFSVIGGSGFLGLRVTRQAQLAGHKVIATFHASGPRAVDVDWRMVDIRHRDDVTALLAPHRPARRDRQRRLPAVRLEDHRRMRPARRRRRGRDRRTARARVQRRGLFRCRAGLRRDLPTRSRVSPYGAAKAAAETAVKGITPGAVIARTSLIIGDGDSQHERLVHALAAGAARGCPVHRRRAVPGARHRPGPGPAGASCLAGRRSLPRRRRRRRSAATSSAC